MSHRSLFVALDEIFLSELLVGELKEKKGTLGCVFHRRRRKQITSPPTEGARIDFG